MMTDPYPHPLMWMWEPFWFGAPTTAQAQRLHSAPSSDPGFKPTSKFGPASVVVMK
jgi:hypothetical protein